MPQIPPSVTAALIIVALFSTVIPIVTLLVLGAKKILPGKAILLGAAAFFVSQVLLRIPLLQMLQGVPAYVNFVSNIFIASFLVGGFTAGLFEESARLCGAAILKKKINYRAALAFGLGHGICEVVFLTGLIYANNLIVILLPEAALAALDESTAAQIYDAAALIAGTAPAVFMVSLLERVFAVIFHVFASLLIFRGVAKKSYVPYLLAVLAHTLFNGISSVIYHFTGESILITESAIALMAAACLVYIIKCRVGYPKVEEPAYASCPKPQGTL